MNHLYATPFFQEAAGDTWRPGGLELTLHGVARCGFPRGARVLDVGCGAGTTVRALCKHGLRAVGVDSSPPPAEGMPLVRADAQRLPFAGACFDGITCECVLSLLPDAEAALRGFARVVRPGGRLLLTDIFVQGEGLPQQGTEQASCLEGACGLEEQERRLMAAGWRVCGFEDHTRRLRELAARLVWYGQEGALCRWLGGAGDKGGCPRYGYGLWLAEKECA